MPERYSSPRAEVRRAVAPRDTLVLSSGTGAGGLALIVRLLRPVLLSRFVAQSLRRFVSNPNGDDLRYLASLAEAGKLRPVIDRCYPLVETGAAMRHIEAGHARGKVVIAIA